MLTEEQLSLVNMEASELVETFEGSDVYIKLAISTITIDMNTAPLSFIQGEMDLSILQQSFATDSLRDAAYESLRTRLTTLTEAEWDEAVKNFICCLLTDYSS